MTKAQHTPGHYIVMPEAYPNCELCQMQAASFELFEALIDLVSLEIKGHTLMSRLEFSSEGRALAEKITRAIAKATGA